MLDVRHLMAPLPMDACRGRGLCLLADTLSQRWCRWRSGSSVDHLHGSFAPLRGSIGPALFGLEPASGFLLLLLLPCLFLLMFLKGLSGSFRHCVTPAMAFL